MIELTVFSLAINAGSTIAVTGVGTTSSFTIATPPPALLGSRAMKVEIVECMLGGLRLPSRPDAMRAGKANRVQGQVKFKGSSRGNSRAVQRQLKV